MIVSSIDCKFGTERASSSTAPRPVTTVCLGGLPIAVADRAASARHLVDAALFRRGQDMRPLYATSANGQVIAMCADDPQLRALFMAADVISADGMPMVHLSRFVTAHALRERVATTDLYHDVARIAQAEGLSFFLLGGSEAVNAAAVERTQALYPGLRIAGRRNGYFSRAEEDAVVAEINASAPDILWIGFGVPLEQQFTVRNLDRLRRVGAIKTSGGLFDFVSGKNPRAPAWMQAAGLEWLYRTLREPRRLGMRYLLTNPKALWLLLTRSA